VVRTPAPVLDTPQVPFTQVRTWQSVSEPGQVDASLQPTPVVPDEPAELALPESDVVVPVVPVVLELDVVELELLPESDVVVVLKLLPESDVVDVVLEVVEPELPESLLPAVDVVDPELPESDAPALELVDVLEPELPESPVVVDVEPVPLVPVPCVVLPVRWAPVLELLWVVPVVEELGVEPPQPHRPITSIAKPIRLSIERSGVSRSEP